MQYLLKRHHSPSAACNCTWTQAHSYQISIHLNYSHTHLVPDSESLLSFSSSFASLPGDFCFEFTFFPVSDEDRVEPERLPPPPDLLGSAGPNKGVFKSSMAESMSFDEWKKKTMIRFLHEELSDLIERFYNLEVQTVFIHKKQTILWEYKTPFTVQKFSQITQICNKFEWYCLRASPKTNY